MIAKFEKLLAGAKTQLCYTCTDLGGCCKPGLREAINEAQKLLDLNLIVARHDFDAAPKPSAEPVAFDWPEYHEQGMGCGLEDRCITDRYEAMRHGWECAMDRAAEMLDNLGPLFSGQPPVSEDRNALIYLMQQFDTEISVCENCGHEETTAIKDSARWLREYLASHPPAVEAQEQPAPIQTSERLSALEQFLDYLHLTIDSMESAEATLDCIHAEVRELMRSRPQNQQAES